MSPHSIVMPAQILRLQPTDEDGRWIGSLQAGVSPSPTLALRVEAYAFDSNSPAVQELIEEAEILAFCHSPLQTIDVDGREAMLVAFPAGR